MEKRLVLTIGLSLLVLLGWSMFIAKPQPVVSKQVRATVVVEKAGAKEVTIKEVQSETPTSPEKTLSYKLENLEVFFNENRASINEVIFKNHGKSTLILKRGFEISNAGLLFKKISQDKNSITFRCADGSKEITKKFAFDNSNNTMELRVDIKNLTSSPIKINLPIILGVLDFSSKNSQSRFQDLTIGSADKTIYASANKNAQYSYIKFLGLRDRYFCAIIQGEALFDTVLVNKINNSETEYIVNTSEFSIQPNSQNGHSFKTYIGPQELKILNLVNPDWTVLIHYGTFDLISQVLLQALDFLHKIFRNWGLAIIALSILVYLLLYPLSIKQMRSMKEMQAIQPLVEKIREENKNNPQKMNKEIMELYREHKVNPFGGCLPLILQMPIFFALYNALMRSFVLKGARFLWIKDLSEPDNLFKFPFNLPILGEYFNILPVIMAIGMFIQQKISTVNATGTTAEQQKIMLIVMPVMFCFIFYTMPAGLVLYWLVNSILMLVFQMRMAKAK
jgi:YidC/Oxa1 family membrane protein insertase